MDKQSEAMFSNQPSLTLSRTIIPMGHDVKFTFNAGRLIPIDCQKVLPGDTFNYKNSFVLRSSTPLVPVMDNAYFELAHFYINERIVWEHAKDYRGENYADGDWEDVIEYEKPTIEAPEGGWDFGTNADYLGIVPKVSGFKIDALPFRGIGLTYNEFYRDQKLQKSIPVDLGDSDVVGSNGDNYMIDAILGGKPLKVCKFKDVFTTAMPAPEAGPEALLPLGSTAPVVTTNENIVLADQQGKQINPSGVGVNGYNVINITGLEGGTALKFGHASGLETDLSTATAASINDLRNSIVIQHILERNARNGSRFREIINAAYGVRISDKTNQIPEYLGGKRIPLNMNQVVQTSGTTETSPQGSTAAFSLTVDVNETFTKSFEEWGYILTFVYIRNENTYQDGIERQWFETSKWDEYDPAMANIGSQPVLNREIFVQGNEEDEEIFGWQQAWYNYRYRTDRVAGEFRSKHPQSLDFWHYADDYDALPILGPDWITASADNINRTLAVSDNVADQFHCDFKFNKTAVRVMPLYSIPGLERI